MSDRKHRGKRAGPARKKPAQPRRSKARTRPAQTDVLATPDKTSAFEESFYGDEIETLLANQAGTRDDSSDANAPAISGRRPGNSAHARSGRNGGSFLGDAVSAFSFAGIIRRALRYRTPIFIVLILLVAAGTFAPFLWKKDEQELDASMLTPTVRVIQIAKADLRHEIKSPGTVTFLEKAAVTSKVLGRVEKLFVDQGDFVKRGQVLAQMETFELDLQLKQAQANVHRAQAQLELSRARYASARRDADRRIKDLERIQSDIIEAKADYLNSRRNLKHKQEIYEMGGVSREELKSVYAQYVSSMSRYYQTRKNYQIQIVGFRDEDLRKANAGVALVGPDRREQFIDFNTQVELGDVRVAEAALKNARLEMESTELLIRESTIRSPLDGIIAARAIEIGESAKEGEPLFTVIRMDRVLISTSIPEEEAGYIEVGQEVGYTVDALANFQDTPRIASVYQISPVIDVSTRTAELKIMAENSELDLNPGMFVRCAIATRGKKDAMAVPESSLVDRRTEEIHDVADVFVIQEGLALRRKVLLGDRYGERIEVLEGLQPGEEVAVENVQNLKDGLSVRVRSREKGEQTVSPGALPEPASAEDAQ